MPLRAEACARTLLPKLVVALVAIACAKTSDERRSPATAATEHPGRYAFELDSARRLALRTQAESLEPGDSLAEVIRRLGPPTSDQIAARKENGAFIARILRYDLRRYEAGLANEKYDQYVELSFDSAGRLSRVIVEPPSATQPSDTRRP